MKRTILLMTIVASGCAGLNPQTPDEALTTYIDYFHARDAESIAEHSWHIPARINDESMRSTKNIKEIYNALFSQLELENYDHSEILTKEIISINKNHAAINITFRRVRKDGSVMHPITREATYMMVRNKEKWAIASMALKN